MIYQKKHRDVRNLHQFGKGSNGDVNTGSDEHVTSRCVSWGMGILMVIYYHYHPHITGFHKRKMFISHLLKSSDPSS